jgi:hypothetical protein
MSALSGSVGPGADPRQPYGVLGTATQLTFNAQTGPQPVAAVGVEGIVADGSDSIAQYDDQHFGNAESQPVAAGVLGVRLAPVVADQTVQIESYGFLGGRSPFAGETTGAFGQAADRGVIGIASTSAGIGVYGGSVGGTAVGVFGDTGGNVGVMGRAGPGGLAGHFQGDIRVDGKVVGSLQVDQNLLVNGDVFLANTGGDIAEQFVAADPKQCDPGTVMTVGETGELHPCSQGYDEHVVGIVAGAGTLRPAITLCPNDGSSRTVPIAMVGTAYCKVDASLAAIRPGDLLTTAPTVGHAMKVCDKQRSLGSVIGKALQPLMSGRGLIPVVVTLQ